MEKFKIKPYKDSKIQIFSRDTGTWMGDVLGFCCYYAILGSIALTLMMFNLTIKIFEKFTGGKKDGRSKKRNNTKWY